MAKKILKTKVEENMDCELTILNFIKDDLMNKAIIELESSLKEGFWESF